MIFCCCVIFFIRKGSYSNRATLTELFCNVFDEIFDEAHSWLFAGKSVLCLEQGTEISHHGGQDKRQVTKFHTQ